MRWKDRISRFWIFPAGLQLRLAEAKNGSQAQRKKCTSQGQRIAAGRILNRTGESNMEMPD